MSAEALALGARPGEEVPTVKGDAALTGPIQAGARLAVDLQDGSDDCAAQALRSMLRRIKSSCAAEVAALALNPDSDTEDLPLLQRSPRGC